MPSRDSPESALGRVGSSGGVQRCESLDTVLISNTMHCDSFEVTLETPIEKHYEGVIHEESEKESIETIEEDCDETLNETVSTQDESVKGSPALEKRKKHRKTSSHIRLVVDSLLDETGAQVCDFTPPSESEDSYSSGSELETDSESEGFEDKELLEVQFKEQRKTRFSALMGELKGMFDDQSKRSSPPKKKQLTSTKQYSGKPPMAPKEKLFASPVEELKHKLATANKRNVDSVAPDDGQRKENSEAVVAETIIDPLKESDAKGKATVRDEEVVPAKPARGTTRSSIQRQMTWNGSASSVDEDNATEDDELSFRPKKNSFIKLAKARSYTKAPENAKLPRKEELASKISKGKISPNTSVKSSKLPDTAQPANDVETADDLQCRDLAKQFTEIPIDLDAAEVSIDSATQNGGIEAVAPQPVVESQGVTIAKVDHKKEGKGDVVVAKESENRVEPDKGVQSKDQQGAPEAASLASETMGGGSLRSAHRLWRQLTWGDSSRKKDASSRPPNENKDLSESSPHSSPVDIVKTKSFGARLRRTKHLRKPSGTVSQRPSKEQKGEAVPKLEDQKSDSASLKQTPQAKTKKRTKSSRKLAPKITALINRFQQKKRPNGEKDSNPPAAGSQESTEPTQGQVAESVSQQPPGKERGQESNFVSGDEASVPESEDELEVSSVAMSDENSEESIIEKDLFTEHDDVYGLAGERQPGIPVDVAIPPGSPLSWTVEDRLDDMSLGSGLFSYSSAAAHQDIFDFFDRGGACSPFFGWRTGSSFLESNATTGKVQPKAVARVEKYTAETPGKSSDGHLDVEVIKDNVTEMEKFQDITKQVLKDTSVVVSQACNELAGLASKSTNNMIDQVQELHSCTNKDCAPIDATTEQPKREPKITTNHALAAPWGLLFCGGTNTIALSTVWSEDEV